MEFLCMKYAENHSSFKIVLLVGNPATEPVRGFVVFNIYGLLDNRFVHLCVD